MFILKNENLPKMMADLDTLLSFTEVKGESVSHIMKSRMIIKDLFSLIEEIDDKVENKEGVENVVSSL